jgi:two-component system sensor histidine kinase HydH
MSLVPVSLHKFLLDFVDSLDLPDGVSLTLDAPESAGKILADPVALTRVLTNLVGNACDAMKSKGRIMISAFGRTIEVTDSGPGIAPEDARRIFEPFYSSKGAHGTGLGLAIVREIMRQHGGGVLVRSTPGCGATFCLRFRS